MFDMEAKFADVWPVDKVVEYLESIDSSVYNTHERVEDPEGEKNHIDSYKF